MKAVDMPLPSSPLPASLTFETKRMGEIRFGVLRMRFSPSYGLSAAACASVVSDMYIAYAKAHKLVATFYDQGTEDRHVRGKSNDVAVCVGASPAIINLAELTVMTSNGLLIIMEPA